MKTDTQTDKCNSVPISQQLQQSLDFDSLEKVVIINKEEFKFLIQQVKELENDRISLQQQLSEEKDFCRYCVNEYGKRTCDLLNTRNELARLKLKSDAENSVKLEEFKK